MLLHTCCAPCSAAVIEWLLSQDIVPLIYFYNPNIFPADEYLIRKNELMRYAQRLGLEAIDGDYDHAAWLESIRGHEQQPERGSRCLLCFKKRLLASAQVAKTRGLGSFATTLASSRWKNLVQIAEAGHWAAANVKEVVFFEKNWRKEGLSERRRILLAENAFYNQRYCGCEFSMQRLL